MIVRHCDLQALGYCNRGARLFCRLNGIDWAAFLENGIEAERLRATDDAQAIALIDQALSRTSHGQG